MAIVEEAAHHHELTNVRVLHRGNVAIAIGAQDVPLPTHSIRKSVISALYGPLIEDGVVRLDSTLSELGIDDEPGLSEQERTATLENLLTARSGVYLPLAFESSYDVFQNVPACWPIRGSAAPGTKFHYSNWDFNVLGAIYERVTEIPLFVAIDHVFAQPLGFQDWIPFDHARLRYAQDPLGATPRYPYYAMQLSARDLTRFGQLYLDGGRWEGRQIVPHSWVQQSTRPLVDTGLPSPFGSYGYLWWTVDGNGSALPVGSYSAIGIGGQTLSVIPAHDTVIVAPFTAAFCTALPRSPGSLARRGWSGRG